MLSRVKSADWNRLTNAILLRMARLSTATDVQPTMEIINLGMLVAHLIGQYRGLSADHPVSIKVRQDLPDVKADPELMNLALLQLLDNACKYSKPGSEVSVELNRHGEFAEVLVTNDGCSIREEESERIFERFYRGIATEKESSGAGLGLYVARKIVRAHEGHLDLCRNRNAAETTTFRLRLPIVEGGNHNGNAAG